MRTRISGLVLLALGLFLTPNLALAQDVAPAPQHHPYWLAPLGNDRPEEGGFYIGGGFLYMSQSNPIRRQDIAYRGFIDIDGSLSGGPGTEGTRYGSFAVALNSRDVSGPVSRQPGFAVYAGWRFEDGSSFMIDIWHMSDTRYSATASIIPPTFAIGVDGAESFLFAPVYNFTPDYAGPPGDVLGGSLFAGYGIWNAATIMTIDFIQRFDQVRLDYRVPIDEPNDTYRAWGIVGFRSIVMFERFRWRTVNEDVTGLALPEDIAIYSNTVSNRMYGGTLGCGCEYYWGSTSYLGAFSGSVEATATLAVDVVKERARYERADRFTAATRAINEYTIAPVFQFDASVWWRPTLGVEVRCGWDFLAMFNTVAAPHPVDFNFGRLTPGWERGTFRWLNGLHAGVAITF